MTFGIFSLKLLFQAVFKFYRRVSSTVAILPVPYLEAVQFLQWCSISMGLHGMSMTRNHRCYRRLHIEYTSLLEIIVGWLILLLILPLPVSR